MAQDNPNFPIGTASINWFDSSNNLHIRVYSTDGYNVTEWCIDQNGSQPGWYVGGFSEAGSAVSATCWVADGQPSIRVYCTFEDVTQEWTLNPGQLWEKGNTFP